MHFTGYREMIIGLNISSNILFKEGFLFACILNFKVDYPFGSSGKPGQIIHNFDIRSRRQTTGGKRRTIPSTRQNFSLFYLKWLQGYTYTSIIILLLLFLEWKSYIGGVLVWWSGHGRLDFNFLRRPKRNTAFP